MASVGDPFVEPFIALFYAVHRSRKKLSKEVHLIMQISWQKICFNFQPSSASSSSAVSKKFFFVHEIERKNVRLPLTFNECQADETRCVEGFDSPTHTFTFTSSLHHAWERKKVFDSRCSFEKDPRKDFLCEIKKSFCRWSRCTWCKLTYILNEASLANRLRCIFFQ